jgi:2,4-diketo-3-deoxy-L-fuconate hydrolase
MKLIRFGDVGFERAGVLLAGGVRKDCSGVFGDWDRGFFAGGGLEKLGEIDFEGLPDVGVDERWGACVARPGKVVCIGLNYRDHAAEMGTAVPDEPLIFQKAVSSVAGPNDPILIPRGSAKTVWEIELAVVIGKDAKYLESVEQASDAIAGYCVANDFSERAFQKEHCGQWTKGKSCDSFCPLGPWLVTKDEIGDVNNLSMALDVNGQRMQTGNTQTMLFDVFFLVHYLSQFMTLEAGDVISTGTPPGVGMGMKPPRFLQAGDRVSMSIEHLGRQEHVCVDA